MKFPSYRPDDGLTSVGAFTGTSETSFPLFSSKGWRMVRWRHRVLFQGHDETFVLCSMFLPRFSLLFLGLQNLRDSFSSARGSEFKKSRLPQPFTKNFFSLVFSIFISGQVYFSRGRFDCELAFLSASIVGVVYQLDISWGEVISYWEVTICNMEQ